MSLLRSLILACALLSPLLPPTAAIAASAEDVRTSKRHYKKGMTAYNLRHFDAAIVEFERAYALNPEPVLLYNIAQSHRQMGRPEQALFFYRRYLEGAPAAANRADVERRVRELEEQVKRESKVAPPAAEPVRLAPPPASAAPAPTVMPAVTREPEATTRTAAPAAAEADAGAGRSLRIAGLSVGAFGLTAVAAGVAFGLKAQSQGDDVSSAARFDPDADSAGRRAQTLQWVFYGAGAAALVTGAVLYYVGHDARDGRVAVAPTASTDGFGAVLTGAF